MDGPRECHSEVKPNKGGGVPYDNPYMWNLKRNDANELTKQRDRA